MDKDTAILRRMGMNPDQERIYLTLLRQGLLPVSRVSQLAKIPRVNCYHHLEKMEASGWVQVSKKKKVKHYQAVSPKGLLNEQLARVNDMKMALPQLLALMTTDYARPKVRFYEGITGIQAVYDAFLELPKAEIVSFTHFESVLTLPKRFLRQHFNARFEAGISSRYIAHGGEGQKKFESEILFGDYPVELLEIFLLASEVFTFASEVTIWNGKIAIINYENPSPLAVLIEHHELYRTHKAIFDLAWLGATSFIA